MACFPRAASNRTCAPLGTSYHPLRARWRCCLARRACTVLRALAEGRIRWAFWPPGTDPQTISKHQGEGGGAGIWIAHDQGHDDDEDYVDDNEGSTVEMVRVFLSGQCMLTLIWIPSPLTLISPNSRFRGKQLRVIAGSPS